MYRSATIWRTAHPRQMRIRMILSIDYLRRCQARRDRRNAQPRARDRSKRRKRNRERVVNRDSRAVGGLENSDAGRRTNQIDAIEDVEQDYPVLDMPD